MLGFFAGRWTAPQPAPLRVTEVVHDTIQIATKIPVEVVETVTRSVPANVDTALILKKYFSENRIKFQSEANQVKIEGKGIVVENTLDSIEFNIVNYRPTQIIRPEYHNSLSAGMMAGNGIVAPCLTYRRKDWEFGIGYDVLTENQIGLLLRVNYRFKQW